jgi:DNA-binding CsgD family transcriptional regulator
MKSPPTRTAGGGKIMGCERAQDTSPVVPASSPDLQRSLFLLGDCVARLGAQIGRIGAATEVERRRLHETWQAAIAWAHASGCVHLYAIFSPWRDPQEKLVAARQLYEHHLGHRPIHPKRWQFHYHRINRVLTEQAELHGTTRKKEFQVRAIQAIFVFAADIGSLTPAQAMWLLPRKLSGLLLDDLIGNEWRTLETCKIEPLPCELPPERERQTRLCELPVERERQTRREAQALLRLLTTERQLARARLSRREKEVFALLCQGNTLGEAAERMGIAAATARVLRARASKKIRKIA